MCHSGYVILTHLDFGSHLYEDGYQSNAVVNYCMTVARILQINVLTNPSRWFWTINY